MLAAAEKGAKLTHNLLAFGRKLVIKPSPVKLNAVIKGVEKIVRGLVDESIKVECVPADPALTIMADAPHVEQALINLVTNARDSMPQGGTLRVSGAEVVMDAKFIKYNGFGKEGAFGVLSVSDTGMGMDEATKQRIFEPFYTTKAPGMGTGLGLSTVYGVVKQHGGYIDVRSEPGSGSTFSIYLPQVKLMESSEAAAPATPLSGGTETVLLAEDDNAVRKITKDVLEKFGYKVLEAEDGERAVNVFMENKDEIDLLLFDIAMPKKTGREAYDEIARVRPGVKALFTSGHVTEVVDREVVGAGLEFISKPASPRQIIRKVREVLDKGA
jgi:CheY-like chemotaxis protein